MKLKDLHHEAVEKPPEISQEEQAQHMDACVDRDSEASMDASDPPSFNPGVAAPNDLPPPHDERIQAGKPVSPSARTPAMP